MFKKLTSALLCIALLASTLAGCGGNEGSSSSSGDGTSSTGTSQTSETSGTSADTSESNYDEFLTVDVYDAQANYSGIQGGWVGEIIKEKFNMELNIISEDGSTFQTRSAAGNLGDIVLASAQGGQLQDLVTAGLIQDLTPYLEGQDNLETYMGAIETTSSLVEEDGLWAVPSEVSTRSATEPLGGTDPNSGAYIRWDLYKELGYPEMNTLEDLLPVLKDMQDIAGTSDSGQPVYGISLFKDWDSNSMGNAGAFAAWYGYDSVGFAMFKADGSGEVEDMLSEDSQYMRGLKFLFQANQMGLVDPESTTQNYDTLVGKYQDGSVLFGLFPWMSATYYNTEAHLSEGKGMYMAEIKDETIRQWGCYDEGNTEIVAMVGSKAQDPQRMVDFINWLYSPEGISVCVSRYCGPENVLYTVEEDGPVLTDLGKQCFIEGDGTMPEEYGGGSWLDGSAQFSYKIVSAGEINPDTGYTYDPTLWDSYSELNTNPVLEDWQEHMGASNPVEFINENNQQMTSPGISFVSEPDSTEIETLRSQINSVVIENSWKAVFAASEDEFNSYIDNMIETTKGLGYDDVFAVDKANAEAKRAQWAEKTGE
ncbi:MAG: ABC transporter substrate-binding protein [Acutalibacter sp.]|jgi:putative aldouronate transport system substrate-binding protein